MNCNTFGRGIQYRSETVFNGGVIMTAKVFFSRDLSPEKVVAMYKTLGVELPGKVAVKLHSGEKGNQNFLRPEFWKPMIDEVKGTVVECNTAYGWGRFRRCA